MNNPKVTVLMPVYNAKEYLKEAIDSILSQTFTDFEFLIINDGSTDRSGEILNFYKDTRIKLIHNSRNKGLIYTLNKGLELARGEYIVRMDADDISMPNRIKEQVEFMDSNQSVGACGCFLKILIWKLCYKERKLFTESLQLKQVLLFETPLMHPTVIIRKSIIEKYNLKYNPEHLHIEDFGLWAEMSKYSHLANLPRYLLKYRIHPQSITKIANKNIKERIYEHLLIFKKGLAQNDIMFNEDELYFHSRCFVYGASEKNDFARLMDWLKNIKKQNKEILNDILGYAIFKFCFLSTKKFGLTACYNYLRLNSTQNFYYIPDTTYLIKFIIKSLIR